MGKAYPYASACLIRSDSATLPAGSQIEHRGTMRDASAVSVGLYEGAASHGHATHYQRVRTYWVQATVMGAGPADVVKRQCWTFSGKGAFERADKAYRAVCANVADSFPGCDATFPTAGVLA